MKWSGRHLNPEGNRGKVETPQPKPRRLDFLPAKKQVSEAKWNELITHEKLFNTNKVCENSLNKKNEFDISECLIMVVKM